MSSENVRIKLLERDDVTPEVAALYDALLAQRGVVPNMFKALAYSPDIVKGVAGFLKPLLSDGAHFYPLRIRVCDQGAQHFRAEERRIGGADRCRGRF